MTQYAWVNIDPATETGTALATRLNSLVAALRSGNKGPTAPTDAVGGTIWIDDSATPWVVKRYDGADWIAEGSFNASTNVFTSAQAAATTSLAGLMSAADKTKLDGVAAGATVNQTVPTPVALTDGATPALDASLGDFFTLITTQNPAIAVPSNPTNGKAITIRITASGGTRTPTLNIGTGGFQYGTVVTALPAIPSGQDLYIGCRYNSTKNKWAVLALSAGFA